MQRSKIQMFNYLKSIYRNMTANYCCWQRHPRDGNTKDIRRCRRKGNMCDGCSWSMPGVIQMSQRSWSIRLPHCRVLLISHLSVSFLGDYRCHYAFSALTLLVGWQEEHPARKKWGWWRWALVSPDGVAPSRMVNASVNLPLHHKVQKFSSGTGSPGWSQKKGRKTFVVVVV